MISDLAYSSKNLYITNQVRFRSTYSLSNLNTTGLYTRDLCYLVNILIDKSNIYKKKKS